MTRRKTDGERIVDGLFRSLYGYGPYENQRLSRRVNRLIRKRMGEAWEEGWFDRDCHEADWNRNPYRGGRRKK
jgi:hypothetical protein